MPTRDREVERLLNPRYEGVCEYRCRRCGKRFPGTEATDFSDWQNLREVADAAGECFDQTSTHRCCDGSVGIGDCVGIRLTKQPKRKKRGQKAEGKR